jgi:signal transduction histidine kinase/HAMP domain-containing protein
MILSLRTTSYTAAIFVALILGFLLLLGSRQYRSHKEYENIIKQNEKIIFQFATIREHITESLLENRHQQLRNITSEIENLNVNITQILQQPIIPDEYRISFAGQVDFAGIILLLRGVGSGNQTQAKIRQLNQEIRILGERLMLFDRVIVEHVKRKLVGFQNFVIGLLAIILFIVIYILLFWHRQIAAPLIDLVKQAKEVTSGKRSAISVRKKGGEVAELAGSFQNLLLQQNRTTSEFTRYNKVLEMVHNVSESVWHAQTRDAVFNEVCRGVLTNSDYVLTWIGIPKENDQILPVIADGSTTMSRQERDECMTALLTAAEENEKYDSAHKALDNKSPVVIRDILEGLPKGPFKNTPFASNKSDCIALPLVYDQQIFGVMTIYSIAPLSFSEEEIELLKGMSREIVFAIFALTAKESNKTLARLQADSKKAYKTETIKASKLAAMGELSVGVANEINNLTNGLINYTQILSEEIEATAGKDNHSIELLNNVIKEGERISQIVQQLLFFNSNRAKTKEAVKINKVIEDSSALMNPQFRYDGINASMVFPEIVPSVQVNVQEMQHVFLNLLSNARYSLNQRYSGQHPKKRIEIKGEVVSQNGAQRLKIVCTDFGVGIHPNVISKVFEPFFSTKPEGVGTGLGLSICRSLIEDNNGTLNIESILDNHTTITMELPVAA